VVKRQERRESVIFGTARTAVSPDKGSPSN
jgi:hypothetical protein